MGDRPSGEEAGSRSRLEDQFFGPGEAAFLEEFRRRTDGKNRRDALAEVVRIQDPRFIDRLIALDIRPETAVALFVVPLVCVAWADGKPDAKEQDAILRAAQDRGATTAGLAQQMLAAWLKDDPTATLLPRWKRYVARLWECFTPAEQWTMRRNLLGATQEVAEASGSLLGLTSGISAKERAVLDDLAKVLS